MNALHTVQLHAGTVSALSILPKRKKKKKPQSAARSGCGMCFLQHSSCLVPAVTESQHSRHSERHSEERLSSEPQPEVVDDGPPQETLPHM